MGCINMTLSGLAQDCQSSRGGLKNLWIAQFEEGQFIETAEHQAALADSKNLEGFKKYYVRPHTSTFSEAQSRDDVNGYSFITVTLNAVFNRMSTVSRIEMSEICRGDIAVIAQDENGEAWLLTMNSPLVPNGSTGNIGTNSSDGNKYTLVAVGEQNDWAMPLSDDLKAQIMAIG